MPAKHGCMHPSSEYIKTVCNEDVIAQLEHLSIGAHRLLLIMLSRVTTFENANGCYSVITDFSDYCRLVGQKMDDTGSRIRDIFYELRRCSLVVPMGTRYYAASQQMIVEFRTDFVSNIKKNDIILLPLQFFQIKRGGYTAGYRSGLQIYMDAARLKRKATVRYTVNDLIRVCGGIYSECTGGRIRNWQIHYIKKIESSLKFLKETGMIKTWCYKIEGKSIEKQYRDPLETNNYKAFLETERELWLKSNQKRYLMAEIIIKL